MRITINIDGVEAFSTEVHPEATTEIVHDTRGKLFYSGEMTPPEKVLRAAETIGAENAGPPPADLAAESGIVDYPGAEAFGGSTEMKSGAINAGEAPAIELKAAPKKKTTKKK